MRIVVDNETAASKVQPALRPGSTVHLIGEPGSGKTATLVQILIEALRAGRDLSDVALLTWRSRSASELVSRAREELARQQGFEPDLPLDYMIPGATAELFGSVCTVVEAHSFENRPLIVAEQRAAVVAEYLKLIERVADLGDGPADDEFRRSARRQIDSAIRLSIHARLNMRSSDDEYRAAFAAGRELPAPSFVDEVIDYYSVYRQQEHVIDLPDLLSSKLQPSQACRLALLDDAHEFPPLALHALRALLPDASFVITGTQLEGPCNLLLELEAPRDKNERHPARNRRNSNK